MPDIRDPNYIPGQGGGLATGMQDCGLGRPVKLVLPWPKTGVPYPNTVRHQVWKKYDRYFNRCGKINPETDHAKDLESLVEVPCHCVLVICPPKDGTCILYDITKRVVVALVESRALSKPGIIHSLFVRRGGRVEAGQVLVTIEEMGL